MCVSTQPTEDTTPNLSLHGRARVTAPDFAARTLVERKRWADEDPDGEAGAVAPLAPVVERIARAEADLAEQEARIARIGMRLPPDDIDLVGQWLEPEDRGTATMSPLGGVEYVEDLVTPGRIVAVAAEEGVGKSFTITGELGMRVAVAGGSFAGTWPVLKTGPVLVLSEMHADDDYSREETILSSLGHKRADLTGRYYRLPLMRAAGGSPALTVAPWRAWVTAWLREHRALVLIIDTATGATQVDPWGQAIQAVYASLRTMVDDYPELAIILLLHLKKPSGRGERRISDVLGEWGRWCDVVVMLDAADRAVAVEERRQERRQIIADAIEAGSRLLERLVIEHRDGDAIGAQDHRILEWYKAAHGAVVEADRAQLGRLHKPLGGMEPMAEVAERLSRLQDIQDRL
jgi:hypothetical protein